MFANSFFSGDEYSGPLSIMNTDSDGTPWQEKIALFYHFGLLVLYIFVAFAQ